ncbi:MAG: FecR family protein [Prevotella sp.]|nr:FecR family protein [Prevotella sp.]
MIKILSENLKLILIGVISILMVIAGAIVLSLYFGGDVARRLVITDISGTAHISRDGKRINAGKQTVLQSGDVITTSEESFLRISVDRDKFVWVEPDSNVYIYFTDVDSKGDISVNLTKGAVICRLNNKLRKNATFALKTPNSSVSVRGTVFRAEFDYVKEYMGYKDVMITQVQNFDGTVALQLYDADKQPYDMPMILIERTAAQMLTSEEVCKYGYLNYSFDLLTLNDAALGELIRSSAEKEMAFTPEELNRAYKIVRDERLKQETATESVSDTPETTVTTVPTTTETTTVTTSPPAETEDTTSYGTLATTLQTHSYTTYSGVKWWELTGNTNTGTDDYEDWFPETNDDFGEEEITVTAGTSANAETSAAGN